MPTPHATGAATTVSVCAARLDRPRAGVVSTQLLDEPGAAERGQLQR